MSQPTSCQRENLQSFVLPEESFENRLSVSLSRQTPILSTFSQPPIMMFQDESKDALLQPEEREPTHTRVTQRPGSMFRYYAICILTLALLTLVFMTAFHYSRLPPSSSSANLEDHLLAVPRYAPSYEARLEAGFEVIKLRAEREGLSSNWTKSIYTNALNGWQINTQLQRSWIDLNPGWKMYTMDDNFAQLLIEEHCGHMPDIVSFWQEAPTFVIKADCMCRWSSPLVTQHWPFLGSLTLFSGLYSWRGL